MFNSKYWETTLLNAIYTEEMTNFLDQNNTFSAEYDSVRDDIWQKTEPNLMLHYNFQF